ncbi:MAG: hypothetical protein AB7F09_06680 [Parvibaculaceae bacterium]
MAQKRTRSKSKKPFTGILLKPIERPDSLVIRAMAKNDPDKFYALMVAASEQVNDQEVERLVALARHYGVRETIPVNDQIFRTLFCLAREFVPGFQFSDEQPRSRGRPAGSGQLGGWELVSTIEGLVAKGKTVASACAVLSRKNGRWKGRGSQSIQTAYYAELRRLRESGASFQSHPLYSHLREVLKEIEARDTPEDAATKNLG